MLNGLTESERTLGACVVDIGAGSTEIVAYYDGAAVFTSSIGIGGEHFTNDAAIGLRCTLAEAERLKCTYGTAVVTSVPADNVIEVPAGASPRVVSQRYLAEILEPRARELFELLRDALRAGGVLDNLGAGVFITGGVGRLPMIHEICEQVLRCPAQVEAAVPLTRMPYELITPEMASVTGLLAYAHRTRNIKRTESQGLKDKLRQLFAGA
jgi:cell division protein FtsA